MSLYDSLKKTISKNRVLVKNFSSLSILQISQYIFPLITFPYLVRVLGPDGFGLVAFATAFVGYFGVLTDYGFNLSATREVSINRGDKKELTRIFNSVITVKLILFLISTIIITPLVFGFNRFSQDYEIYLISFISIFGLTLFPVWFFQGVERMGFITVISVVVKAFWVISVFIFIHSYEDIQLLVLLTSASSLITGITGIITVKIFFNIKFKFAESKDIKYQLIEGWHYFISNVSISLYTISNVFILGLFANNTIVGYYSAADRIRYAIQNLTSTTGRTVFPHLSAEFIRSKEAALKFIRNYIKTIGTISFLTCLVLFLFAEKIVLIILGDKYLSSVILLKIISFLPFIIFFSNVAGIQIMLNLGYKKEFARIIFIAGAFNILVSFIIVPIYFSIGTSIIVVITELLVTSQMLLFLSSKKIYIFRNLL